MPLPSPYRAALRTPGVCGAFVTSLIGRLSYGIVSLSLVLTLTAGGRYYGLAGLVMALFSLTVVLVSPLRARMVDQYGPRRVLPPMAASFAAVLVAIAAIPARSGGGDVVIAVLAAVAGACALGGLGYGAVAWRIPAQRRLALLAMGLAVLLIPAALSPNLLVLALLIGLAGVLVAPAYATANVLAADLASPQARTRAGNWVSSGYNAGGSAGAALAGQLVGRVPLGACLPLLAGPALLAVVPLLRARLTPTAEQPGTPGGSVSETARPAPDLTTG
jgi:MFS family permease